MSDEADQLDILQKQRKNSKEKAVHLPMSHPQIEHELGAQFLLADFNSLREFMAETNARSGLRESTDALACTFVPSKCNSLPQISPAC